MSLCKQSNAVEFFDRICLSSAKSYFFNKSGKFVRKTKLVREVFPKVIVLEHKVVDFNPLNHFIMKMVDEKRRNMSKTYVDCSFCLS